MNSRQKSRSGPIDMGNSLSQPATQADPEPQASRKSPPNVHLPDELLLLILSHIPQEEFSQSTLHAFTLISRQWYNVGISRLYAAPYLTGAAFDLFVRTICPSINLHVRKSELAQLVKVLDLSHIVHQGSKAVTARLLGRTKGSLEVFIAPQASFAVNCWAALSKCQKLRYLNLSLVSESISYQSLTQTVRSLGELEELYMPRCSASYDHMQMSMNIKWPAKLRLLNLSGGVHGKFMYDLSRQPQNFPSSLTQLNISHCPKLGSRDIGLLLQNLGQQLLHLEIFALPQVQTGQLSGVLTWCSNLEELVISLDYIDIGFGDMPHNFNPSRWEKAKPLTSLTLVTDGNYDADHDASFTAVDLFDLLDERYFGRLRYLTIAESAGWQKNGGGETGALEDLLWAIDKENWEGRRWHYAGLEGVPAGTAYDVWMAREWNRAMWGPRCTLVLAPRESIMSGPPICYPYPCVHGLRTEDLYCYWHFLTGCDARGDLTPQWMCTWWNSLHFGLMMAASWRYWLLHADKQSKGKGIGGRDGKRGYGGEEGGGRVRKRMKL